MSIIVSVLYSVTNLTFLLSRLDCNQIVPSTSQICTCVGIYDAATQNRISYEMNENCLIYLVST